MALARLGSGDEAAELFHLLNPVNHARTGPDAAHYRGEPYVLAGDVCAHPEHAGRAGWTWYTGAAGWLHRAGLESIAGLRRHGDTFALDPCIPGAWPGYGITWRLGRTHLRDLGREPRPPEPGDRDRAPGRGGGGPAGRADRGRRGGPPAPGRHGRSTRHPAGQRRLSRLRLGRPIVPGRGATAGGRLSSSPPTEPAGRGGSGRGHRPMLRRPLACTDRSSPESRGSPCRPRMACVRPSTRWAARWRWRRPPA